MEYASGGELFDLLCQEIVIQKYLININIHSLQKKKPGVYSNK